LLLKKQRVTFTRRTVHLRLGEEGGADMGHEQSIQDQRSGETSGQLLDEDGHENGRGTSLRVLRSIGQARHNESVLRELS
jgi:hypothetical protein